MQPKKNALMRSLSQPLISIPMREVNNTENQKNNPEEIDNIKNNRFSIKCGNS